MTAPEHPWHPITEAARGIYMAARLDPENPCYTTAECVQLPAAPDVAALERALRLVYAENPGFRVRCAERDGRVLWREIPLERFLDGVEVLRPVTLPAPEAAGDQTDGEREEAIRETVLAWCSEQLRHPLEALSGQTVRSALIECGGRFFLLHCFHHLVADGFAAFDALRRLGRVYGQILNGQDPVPSQRPGLAELAAQDADDVPVRAEHAEAFQPLLQELEQGEDHSLAGRAADAPAVAHRARRELDPALQEALLGAGKAAGTGWPAAVVAAAGSYLTRVLGLSSARYGVPQMNRVLPGGPRVAARTGCTAVNLLPVAVSAGGSPAAQLGEVTAQLARNQAHGLVRQEELERQARRRGARLFGAQLNVVPFDAVLPFGQGTARVHNVSAGPVPDLTVTVRGMPGRGHPISLELDANPALYGREQAEAHAERLVHWLGAWGRAAVDGTDVDELEQATPAELARLDELAEIRVPRRSGTLWEGFAAAAAEHPEETAVIEGPAYPGPGEGFRGRRLTYAELAEAARTRAAALASLGVAPGDPVALRTHRGLDQYVSVYALLAAGAVYLPVDPQLPAERVAGMLADAGCPWLLEGPGLDPLELGSSATEHPVTEHPVTALTAADLARAEERVCAEQAASAGLEDPLPGTRRAPEDLAYILFTSGSTGRPKGVPITHAGIDNRLAWQQHLAPVGPGDRVAHKTAVSFDVHVWELYWPLRHGAGVVVAAPEGHKDPEHLARLITEARVDCLHFVPTMLSAFLASPGAARTLAAGAHRPRTVVCSGETLTREQVAGCRRMLGTGPLNLYGPTEAAVDVTAWATEEHPEEPVVPIGWPAWNTGVHVLDASGHRCPVGVVGHLCLSGVQVTPGYLHRPEADAAAFRHLPAGRLGDEGPERVRVYRTGDLARWRPDGALEYRGRTDHQVKIGGQRLELGEVETVLAAVPGVSAAVALVRRIGAQEVLVGFLEAAAEEDRIVQRARDHAERHLPGYMVPTVWQVLQRLPITANGKADRRALAEREITEAPGQDGAPGREGGPATWREAVLGELFGQVLEREPLGPGADFFAAGGASLTALELVARIDERLGLPCSLAQIFAHPTPAALSAALGEESTAGLGADLAPTLLLRRGSDPAAAPLVLLPPAGGLGWCYAGLLPALGPARTVWTLQAPQFTDPQAPEPADLEELAPQQLPLLREIAPDGADLAGWSVGGMAAVHLAGLAEREGGPRIGAVGLLDAYPPSYWRSLPAPGPGELWRALMRMGGVEPQAPPRNLEETLAALREHGSPLAALDDAALRTSIAAVRRAMAHTRGADPAPVRARLLHVGAERTLGEGAPAQAWARTGALERQTVPGDHAAVIRGAGARALASMLGDGRG